jgi:hypothetical protein
LKKFSKLLVHREWLIIFPSTLGGSAVVRLRR